MREIWKPIKGFEGFYEVSNMGNVRSLDRIILLSGERIGEMRKYTGKPLHPLRTKTNLIVHLQKEGYRKTVGLGRLVALHFLDGFAESGRKQVKYKDNDFTNCSITNLE